MTGVVAGITRINPIISDMVCAWRAIVLWRYDRRVVVILSACIVATFAFGIYDIKLALTNHPGTQGGDGIDEGKVAAMVVGPMLGTNILSTSLIAWKAWEFRKNVSAHLKKGSTSDRAEKVLALLIESGFAYCVLWIFFLLIAFKLLPGSGSYIVNLVMLFLSSMYPAIIIIIACTQAGDGYNARPDASGGLDLTTIHFSVGENTADISLPTTSTSHGLKSHSEVTPNERR